MLSAETWPVWKELPKDGVKFILEESKIDESEYEFGHQKIFIKNPKSVSELKYN